MRRNLLIRLLMCAALAGSATLTAVVIPGGIAAASPLRGACTELTGNAITQVLAGCAGQDAALTGGTGVLHTPSKTITWETGNTSVMNYSNAADNGLLCPAELAAYPNYTLSAQENVTGAVTGGTATAMVGDSFRAYECVYTLGALFGVVNVEAVKFGGIPATVPGAPTKVKAVRGNAKAVVTWTAPASNGGSTIEWYTVTCVSSDGGVTRSMSGTGPPITVSGLTNGKTYTCTVTATNLAGTSAPSAASNAVVPATVPRAPTIETATAGNGSVAVAFTGPGNNGGSTILGYTVTCVSSNGGVTGSMSGTGSPITVSGLTSGDTYTCTVTARNAVGTSVPSAALTAVVPATVPGAPTGVTVTYANNTVTVTWNAPASNGGSPITAYYINAYITPSSSVGCTDFSAPPTLSCSFAVGPAGGDLTSGTSYSFVMWALNGVGLGPSSNAVMFTVP